MQVRGRGSKFTAGVGQMLTRHAQLNWTFADQMVVSGSNFLTGILVARYLGIREFGLFSLAWLVILFAQSLQSSVIHAPMMSIGSKQSADTLPSYFAIVFIHELCWLFLSTILIVTGLLCCKTLFPEWNLEPLVWPLAMAALLGQLQDFMRRYFFTIENPRVSFVSDAIRHGSQISTLMFLFLSMPGWLNVQGVFWVMAGSAALGFSVAMPNVKRLAWPRGRWWEISFRHWHFSKWLIVSNTLLWASGEIFYVVTGAVNGASAVGILRAAQNVMGVMHIFFHGLQNFLPMRASQVYRQGGTTELSKFLLRAGLLATLVALIVAVVVCSFAGEIMELLYGPAMRQYSWVLVAYALIYVLMAAAVAAPIGLLATEQTFPIVLSYACSSVVSVILAYPLIAGYGLAGVLVGWAIYTVIQILVPVIAYRGLIHKAEASVQSR